MLKVHHLNESRSQRILWLLEELSLPYEIVQHKRDPQTRLLHPALGIGLLFLAALPPSAASRPATPSSRWLAPR